MLVGFDVSRVKTSVGERFYVALIYSESSHNVNDILNIIKNHFGTIHIHFRELKKKEKLALLRFLSENLEFIASKIDIVGFILDLPKGVNKRSKKKALADMIAKDIITRSRQPVQLICCSDLDERGFIICKRIARKLPNRLITNYITTDQHELILLSDIMSNFIRREPKTFIKRFVVRYHAC